MNPTNYGGAPGYGPTYTQQFVDVLASFDLEARLPGGVLLAQGFGIVNKGRVLGKITASGLFAPYTSTTLTAAPGAGATSITVNDATAFIVGDNVMVGTEAGAHAITAINGNTITLGTGLAGTQASGASVTTNDGRSTAVCILDNDQDTTNNNVGASAWIAGIFNSSAVLGADANAKTELKLCYFV